MSLHSYYQADPAARLLESKIPPTPADDKYGVLRNAFGLHHAYIEAPDNEVRTYLFGRMAGGALKVRYARDTGGESFHALERDLLFWRGFLDVAARFGFLKSRAGYVYPQIEIRAGSGVLRAFLERLADEVGDSGWSDPEGRILAQSFGGRLDIRGAQAKAMVELTHNPLDSILEDVDNAEVINRILNWDEAAARAEGSADGFALAKNLSR